MSCRLGVEHQFSGRALETSRASLLYAKLTPFHYFTPDLHFLSGLLSGLVIRCSSINGQFVPLL